MSLFVSPLRILLLEDSSDDASLLIHELSQSGLDFTWERVDSAVAFQAQLSQRPWDIIISDYSMPGFSGSAALDIVRSAKMDLPFIIVSGVLGEEAAVEAMRAGADDFFVKGNTKRLLPAIEREVMDARERQQRRDTEARLRESEERFAKSFHSSPIAISITRLDDSTILEVNDAYVALLGFSREELIGRRAVDLNVRVDPIADRDQIVHHLRTQGPLHNIHTNLRSKEGHLRHTLISLDRIQVGDVECMLTMISDYTVQKQAEAAELEQRTFANALSEIASLLVSSLNMATVMTNMLQYVGRVVAYDAATIFLLDGDEASLAYSSGYSDSTTQKLHALKISADSPLLAPIMAQHTAVLYASCDNPSPWSNISGHSWVQSTVAASISTQETVIGFLVLHRDVENGYNAHDADHLRAFADQTAIAIRNAQLYKQAQEHASELEQRVDSRTQQLRQAKEHVETLLDSTSDAIFLAQANGVIEQSNSAFLNLFGFTASQYGHIDQLVPPFERDNLVRTLAEVTRTGEAAHVDLVCRRHNGERFDAEIAVAPIVEFWTQTPTLICSVRDITRRKVLESELRMALEKEKELRELKSRFVSMISHEFRTPLASIQSSSELLKRYYERLDAQRRELQVNSIQTQVQHLTRLLEDILVISRSEAVGLDFKPVTTNLEALSRGLMDEMTLVDSSHQFELEVVGDCSQADVDEDLMRRTILNLLSNAVKYSPQNTHVRFIVANDSDWFRLEVHDEGIGIPEQDLPHLFEIFHRGSNVARIAGTGLGLALVKLAVDAHGGTIDVRSQVGKGTIFIVRLPRAAVVE